MGSPNVTSHRKRESPELLSPPGSDISPSSCRVSETLAPASFGVLRLGVLQIALQIHWWLRFGAPTRSKKPVEERPNCGFVAGSLILLERRVALITKRVFPYQRRQGTR